MQEQGNYEEDVIDWDDYAQGATDVESYDPWVFHSFMILLWKKLWKTNIKKMAKKTKLC
jgi:hypothetical protein